MFTWHGWQIGSLDSAIVPRIAVKSAELIKHAWHEWLINRPRTTNLGKDENLCLSILGLVHKSGNWVSMDLRLKIFVFIHLPCTVECRCGRSFNSQSRKRECERKSLCQTAVNMKKNKLSARSSYVNNYFHANWRVAKNVCSQRVKLHYVHVTCSITSLLVWNAQCSYFLCLLFLKF